MIEKFIYKFTLLLIFPIVFVYTIYQCIFVDKKYFLNRFGIILNLRNKNNLCIHCASLGEINGAKELIKEIAKDNSILISTNTYSGMRRAKELFPELDVVYFPLDYKFCIFSWLKFSKVKNIIIYETEIWPNFYRIFASKERKLVLVNARINKDFHQNRIAKRIYSQALVNCDLIICKSEYEKKKFLSFDINEEILLVTSNLKYSYKPNNDSDRNPLGIKKYFLMASTHSPDEQYFRKAISELANKGVTTVIAPRHVKKSMKIYKYFQKQGTTPHLYTNLIKNRNISIKSGSIIIINKYGILSKFYNEAKFVYVGGGFSKRGIQNIIEPSSHGNILLVGPNIDNFYEEIESLVKIKCATIIPRTQYAERDCNFHIERYNSIDDETLKKMGKVGKEYNLRFKNVLEKYIEILRSKKIIN